MKIWKYIYLLLLLVLSLAVIAVFQLPDKNLHIIACNVGEGDATLLVYANTQVLIDGGPDKKVLSCLGKYLPFYDRSLELVILTHPDRDHLFGLIDVLRNYKVDNFLYNPINVSKPEYRVLEKEVGRVGVKTINPLGVKSLGLGLMHLDIISPSDELISSGKNPLDGREIPDSQTNSFSIVNLLHFGSFSALLTGDMTPEVSDELAGKNLIGSVDYIKTPHHGSKNGLTENLLKILTPRIAVISVGKNNYGHPAPEILEMLKKYGVKVLRTDEMGDIEIITDGVKFWIKSVKR